MKRKVLILSRSLPVWLFFIHTCMMKLPCPCAPSLSDPGLLASRPPEQKEEKDGVKTEEPAKLPNGDSVKEGGAVVVAAAGGSEEKKKAKTRFMFNIADGGFTGEARPHTHTHTLPFPQIS